jgi:Homeobox KN domain
MLWQQQEDRPRSRPMPPRTVGQAAGNTNEERMKRGQTGLHVSQIPMQFLVCLVAGGAASPASLQSAASSLHRLWRMLSLTLLHSSNQRPAMHSSNHHQQNNATTANSNAGGGIPMRLKPEPHAASSPTKSPDSKLPKASPQPKNPSLSPTTKETSASSPPSQLDDFDIMLFHEDFPHLLAIASKVKGIQKKIANLSTTTICPPAMSEYRAKTALQPHEVMQAVERMQQALTAKSTHPNTPPPKSIKRGRYPITDSLMEDAMLLLQKQYDLELQRYNHQQPYHAAGTPHPSPVGTPFHDNKRGRTSPLTTASPITVKYAKWQTDILMQWMIDNKDSPFPDTDAIAALADQTGLSHSQIVNWTTNVRKRNRKATCENGKKPHHFLDFLFLVHDRESKPRAEAEEEALIQAVSKNVLHPPDARMTAFSESKPHVRPPEMVVPPPAAVPSAPLLQNNRYQPSSSVAVAYSRKAPPPLLVLDTKQQPSLVPSNQHHHEPMPLSTKSNDTIMVEFADGWLMASEHKSPSNANALLGARIQIPTTTTSSHILPSVTADSHDHPSNGMTRNDSFSLGSLEDEDILMNWSAADGFM